MKALKKLLEVEKEATLLISNASLEKENLTNKAKDEAKIFEEKSLETLHKEVTLLEEQTEKEIKKMETDHQELLKQTKQSLAKDIDKKVDEAFKYLLEVIFK